MPVKAAPPPPPPPPIYDWSGLYVGFHEGYLWGTVHDVQDGGFTADSDVKNWIGGFHVGLQKQFAGFGFGGLVLGAEGGLNEPLQENDVSNFGPCAGAGFSCGIRNFKDNWYGGGRLGLAWNWGGGGWLFGGDYLLTVSGGYTTAIFQRASVVTATGVFAGGGNSLAWHNGAYVGAGLEHVLAKGNLVDWVTGIDWQHQFYDDQRDIDANGVGHTLSADVDIIRLRTTLKFK
jgi:outer membrane immunogenic protein